MDLDKCIKERWSSKSYLKKEVDFELVAEILDSGRHAPSSGNMQNWRFIVVKDEKKRKEISRICKNQDFVSKAPVLIVVYAAEIDRLRTLYGHRGEALYAIQNCAAAIQNMLLKAHSLGLATCWIGDFNENELNSILSVEGEVRPQAIITLGYSKEHKQSHKQPLGNFVFFDKWENRERASEYWPLERTVSNTVKKAKDFLFRFK